ncbi:MAG: CPBP family intramembrane metalloprotease [Prolixibacteraceae bacterium]|nr:CPBP family intramembrane metalloprotease [Prolixibacteraceae bacterium]
MKQKNKNIILATEFVVLFIGVPLFLFFEENIIHPSSVLLPILIALILYFKQQKDFHLRDLIRLNISKRTWLQQFFAVIVTGIFLLVFVLIFEPENLFNLPRRNPAIWLAMLGFYPVFSAYGQEVVYRKFLFMRYSGLFRKRWVLILASAVTFSFVHIVYFSVLSLVLTFFAGIYLAWLYSKTKSVLFTGIIHGILGFLIFTVGLGQHFWLDMMQWL